MFKISVNGEEVKSLDVDPRLVESVEVGPYKVPVQFSTDSIDFQVNLKSETDAEYLEALASDQRAEEEKESDKKRAKLRSSKAEKAEEMEEVKFETDSAPVKKAVAKKSVAKKSK